MRKQLLVILALQFILFKFGYPQNIEYLFNSGIEKHKQKDFTGAITVFSQAINLKPDIAILRYCRGLSYFEIEKFKESSADFSKAIEINPLLFDAYYRRGLSYQATNSHKLAIDDFTTVIVIEPQNHECYLSRGISKQALFDYLGAINDYSMVIELDSLNKTALFNRAICKYSLNDFGSAIADLDFVLHLDPSLVDGYYYRGMALIRFGKPYPGCDDIHYAKSMGRTGLDQIIRDYCNLPNKE